MIFNNNKVEDIVSYFSQEKLIKTELKYENQYQLLIAVVLSAQCLDSRVNVVTPSLFSKYKNFKELSQAELDDVFNLIKQISYPETKADRIIYISKVINQQYNDVIPNSFDKLVAIKGIGRKTANLVLSILYDYPGIAVDTHVMRVSNRLGLVSSNDPEKIEMELMNIFPQNMYNKINPWFVIFGRYICKSKNPNCQKCKLKNICTFKIL